MLTRVLSSNGKTPAARFNKHRALITSETHKLGFDTKKGFSMASIQTPEQNVSPYKFIDIGSNLGDPVFRGEYHGKQMHADDLNQILARARSAGVSKQVLTGDCLSGSKEVIAMSRRHDGLYATVGCHPCRANEFESDATTSGQNPEDCAKKYLAALDQLIAEDHASGDRRVVAVGECGLDYDRLSHCSKETQLRYFPPQRNRTSEAHVDFVRIVREHESRQLMTEILPSRIKGVVHSFTGTMEEMKELVELGFSIGINGCSLKTEANLEVVKSLPLDRIMLETDCPWCEIRHSHASFAYLSELPMKEVFSPASIKKERHQLTDEKMVKGRNEPCTIGQVAWIVSKLKGISLDEVVEHAWRNSVEMFGL